MTGSPAYTLTNFNTVIDSPTYKAEIDANFQVLFQLGAWFAPQPNSPAAMNVQVNAGSLFVAGAVVAKTIQTTGTITAPTGSNKRIDRVVINATTGVISVVTGTPTAGTPTIPAIPGGSIPCCTIGSVASPLLSTTTSIGTSLVNDERVGGSGGQNNAVVVLQNQQPNGTAGASMTAGAWNQRVINTEVADPQNLCTLTSNQFTLVAGTYLIWAAATFNGAAGASKLRLRNSTSTTTLCVGESETQEAGQSATLFGIYTVAASQALEVDHWVTAASPTEGAATSATSEIEVYLTVTLTKVA